MRRAVIAGNWKMNNTLRATDALISELIPLVKDAKAEIVICVPYTDIALATSLTTGTNIGVGAQNVAWADKGAFTGEISAEMLLEAGAEYAIIGHSERRQYFGETDESVLKRTMQALKCGLTPIVCIGETEQERMDGRTNEVNERQFINGLKDVDPKLVKDIIIAYEPVWAIGTGKTATKEDANEAIAFIRSVCKRVYGEETANAIRIQYGGSMNAQNCFELMSMPDIDGGLIGGASLKAKDFATIISSAE